MLAQVDCIPCVQRQVIKACRFSNLSEEDIEKVLREVMDALVNMDWRKTPPEIAHIAHGIVRRYAGGDPYAEVKRESNDLGLHMYPELKRIVDESDDPLRAAIRLAIAGNIIDFGAMVDFNLQDTISDVMSRHFAYDSYDRFLRDMERARKILYFFDNAGEIVFDKLLIETLLGIYDISITGVVKAGPIINDATEDDLRYVGLDKYMDEVLFLSNGEVGYERNDPEVGRWIKEHNVVISKGQGNYEGLSEWKGIYYMLMVKCPVVAKSLSATVGDIVFLYR